MALPDPATVVGAVGARLNIPTPYETPYGQSTHPSIVHIPGGLNGFTYYMAMTPYLDGDDEYENPCIVVSNDGITWVVAIGQDNPVDVQPGSPGAYNSDVDLRWYGDALWLFWRTYDPSATGAEETIYYSTSTDGISWSEKALAYSSDHTVRRLLSPTLLLEDGAWTMWAVDIVPSPNVVVRLQGGASPADTWAEPVSVNMGLMRPGKEPWHLSIIRQDTGYVALLADCTQDVSGVAGGLLFCTSVDGLTWTNSGDTVIPMIQDGEHTALYRATMLPQNRGGADGWWVIYAGWINGTPQVWHLYSTWIGPPPPDPDPLPVPPEPVASSEIAWYACDLVTGAKIARLPLLRGNPKWALSMYSSVQLSLPLPTAGPGRIVGSPYPVLNPKTTMYVCVANGVPAWGGILLKPKGGTDPETSLGVVSLEGYLLRRYVGDHQLIDVDEGEIVRTLVGDANNAEGIGLVVDAPNTGTIRTRQYYDHEDVTVYQRLTELAGVQNGVEWTIDLEWTDDRQTHVKKIFRMRPRIGTTAAATLLSSRSAAYVTYEWTDDYSEDRGANDILAYSSGEGSVRPQSQRIRDEAALAAGVPRYEHRWSPSSSITDPDVLDAHAMRKLEEIGNGTVSVDVTCVANTRPARFGVDWRIGDNLDLDLWGHLDPYGRLAFGRAVAAELDPDAGTITPSILLEAW